MLPAMEKNMECEGSWVCVGVLAQREEGVLIITRFGV